MGWFLDAKNGGDEREDFANLCAKEEGEIEEKFSTILGELMADADWGWHRKGRT